jgi:hypothetical protein
MNKKVIITLVVVALSVASILIFKANWGIDDADANIIYVTATDNKALTDNVIADASALSHLTHVDQLDKTELALYFQPLSDNVDLAVSVFANKYSLTQSSTLIYRFASEEFNLFANRALTLGLVVMLILFIYQGVELRHLNWKRWQVGYYIASDFFIVLLVTVVELGVASIFGELGMKMDNPFQVIFAVALGVTLLFRGYEMELVKRMGKDLRITFKDRRPELIMLSCVLVLAGFMPFVVLSWQLAVPSLLILLSIGLNYLTAIYIKPFFVEFMFEQGKSTALLKRKALNKEW